MYRVPRNEEERLTIGTKTSLSLREYPTILVRDPGKFSIYFFLLDCRYFV